MEPVELTFLLSTNPLRSFRQVVCECPNENHKLKLVAMSVILFFICKDLVNNLSLQISIHSMMSHLQFKEREL